MRRNKRSERAKNSEISALKQQIDSLNEKLNYTIRRLSNTEEVMAEFMINGLLPQNCADALEELGLSNPDNSNNTIPPPEYNLVSTH